MAENYNSRCSICTHRHAQLINDFLRRKALGEDGVTFPYIAKAVAKLGGPEVTESALCRHAKKHFDIDKQAADLAAEMFAGSVEEVAAKKVSDAEFLDRIIQAANQMLDSSELRPDLSDAIKAVQTKHRDVLNNADPVTVLLELVSGRSDED
ncbi:MAG: hypothetical protein RQ731_08095 [Anaerosomatales bacterium]|nr:hypothetical protein [Anaerosomatales bacterium]